jgi:acetyl esterase/lipase
VAAARKSCPGDRALSYARWFAQARPGDYLIAAGRVSSSLPLVGRHLEPLGGFLAMGLVARGYARDFVTAAWERREAQCADTVAAVTAGLDGVLAPADLAGPWPQPATVAPVFNTGAHRKRVHRVAVQYGDQPGQLLDVWRRDDLAEAAPVLIFIPGGAWVFGSRKLQGHALMSHLAELGWVCLSIEYRTSPKHRWPRQLIDVKTAIAWARANVAQFGGDQNFVAVAGCSAGGHLASLAGLTPHDESINSKVGSRANTTVDAVVSIYGRYDWEDRSTAERVRFMGFLERVVVQRRQAARPEVYRAASPVARVDPEAPPFLVVHGTSDFLIPVAEARTFVERLRSRSRSLVAYIELPGATHGFDLTDGARTGTVVNAIGLFLSHVHRVRPRNPVGEAV